MKRCPECRRSYSDETLNYCLDDGAALVDGPANDSTATAIFVGSKSADSDSTKLTLERDATTEILPLSKVTFGINNALLSRKIAWIIIALAVIGVGAFFTYQRFSSSSIKSESIVTGVNPKSNFYWEMNGPEQLAFVQERAKQIESLIGDEPVEFDDESLRAIKLEIDHYVERKDSLSQKIFEEGLKVIYGRATQYTPLIIRAYEERKVPPTLGLYQAMIESEYHDCPTPPFEKGPVGMFQFSRKTAALYGLTPIDYCNVEKQSDAAARHMSDLTSDFGEGKSNATLGLLSYVEGAESARDYLRQLRSRGITERSFWVILRHQQDFSEPLTDGGKSYVPRFFAAAIIGESPEAFDLPTPPLTTLRPKKV